MRIKRGQIHGVHDHEVAVLPQLSSCSAKSVHASKLQDEYKGFRVCIHLHVYRMTLEFSLGALYCKKGGVPLLLIPFRLGVLFFLYSPSYRPTSSRSSV